MFSDLIQQLVSASPAQSYATSVTRRFNVGPAHEASRNKPVKTFKPIMEGKGWMTASSLAGYANRNSTSVTTSMKYLIDMGFVERRKSSRNPREYEYLWSESCQ